MYKVLCLILTSPFFCINSQAIDTGAPIPPADVIQGQVFRNLKAAYWKLEGVVRVRDHKGNQKKYPFVLLTSGYDMEFQFPDTPLAIKMTLTPTATSMQVNEGNGFKSVTGQGRLKRLFESDIRYEDLALEWLRWSKTRPVGKDNVKTFDCFVYDAFPPGASQFSRVRFWVTQKHMAFLKVDGYDKNGKVTKRLEVNNVMKIGEGYTIKEMQVSDIVPGRTVSGSRTWVEVQKGTARQ